LAADSRRLSRSKTADRESCCSLFSSWFFDALSPAYYVTHKYTHPVCVLLGKKGALGGAVTLPGEIVNFFN